MKDNIKLFMFDFAGVVTSTKGFPAITDYLAERGVFGDFEIKKQFQNALYNSPHFYMLGKESTEEFWEKTGKPYKVSYSNFVDAFENWFTLNEDVLDIIKKLKENHRVVLVSDNFDACSPAVRKNEIMNSYFDRLYFSNEEHAIKEDGRIFTVVLEKEKVLPGEAFFTDDHIENVITAKNMGIKASEFFNASQLVTDFKELGINI